MKAYIITIGDEILLGNTLNTNAAYIGTQLFEINIQVINFKIFLMIMIWELSKKRL